MLRDSAPFSAVCLQLSTQLFKVFVTHTPTPCGWVLKPNKGGLSVWVGVSSLCSGEENSHEHEFLPLRHTKGQ